MAVSQTGHQVLDLLVLLYSMAWLSRGRGAGRHPYLPFLEDHNFPTSKVSLYLLWVIFRLCCTACGILVPKPEIQFVPPALGAWSENH